MPLTFVVWSARPIQPRMRASRPRKGGEVAGGEAQQRDSFRASAVTTISPTSPIADGIAAARRDDFDKNVLGDLQTRRGGAVGAVGLVGDRRRVRRSRKPAAS